MDTDTRHRHEWTRTQDKTNSLEVGTWTQRYVLEYIKYVEIIEVHRDIHK